MTIVFVTVTIVTIVLLVIARLGFLYLYPLTLREEVLGTGNVDIFRLGNIAGKDLKGSGVVKCNINSRIGCEASDISHISGNLWGTIDM